jgi:hypothetical protein
LVSAAGSKNHFSSWSVWVRVQERAVCPLRVLFPVWSLSGGNKQTAAQFLIVFVIIREFDLLVLVSSSSFGPRVLGRLLNFVFSAGLHLPALKSILFFSPRASSRSQHLFRQVLVFTHRQEHLLFPVLVAQAPARTRWPSIRCPDHCEPPD